MTAYLPSAVAVQEVVADVGLQHRVPLLSVEGAGQPLETSGDRDAHATFSNLNSFQFQKPGESEQVRSSRTASLRYIRRHQFALYKETIFIRK